MYMDQFDDIIVRFFWDRFEGKMPLTDPLESWNFKVIMPKTDYAVHYSSKQQRILENSRNLLPVTVPSHATSPAYKLSEPPPDLSWEKWETNKHPGQWQQL